MSDKVECPNCKKKSKPEEFKFEWHKQGRQGRCPKCNKRVLSTREARGLIKDKNGVAHKRFRNT